jgi:tight adherence protein C
MVGLPLVYVVYVARSGGEMGPLGLLIVAALFLLAKRGSGWWIKGRVRERQNKLERALPGALDLLTVCMEAGLAFDAGLAKVVEKTRGPLADEFARVLQEMQIGKSRRDALRDMSRRAEVRDLVGFVAAIVQADQMGMSLAPVMRSQADEVRTRRRQRAEEQAMKAAVKMIFPLILCILPSTMIVVLGPAIVTMATKILPYMVGWS